MSFQDIIKIEKPDFYLDLAFRRAKEASKKFKSRKKDPVKKAIDIELVRISTIRETLNKIFKKVLLSFPSIDGLTDFYQELVKITLDYRDLKKSLGAVNWLTKKINEFVKNYSGKIRKAQTKQDLDRLRREYYGRISSLVKQIKDELIYLEKSRKIIRNFPVIKSDIRTIVIYGFPNVGKTTLLYKLTGSKPEINSYPFTTKSINVAYTKGKEVQLVDVPGTLNRFDKMNDIEKQAVLSVKHLADQLIYVFDLTEPYPLKDQIKLFNQLKKIHKKIIIYLSKQDLIGKKEVKEFEKKFNFLDLDSLKEIISSQ